MKRLVNIQFINQYPRYIKSDSGVKLEHNVASVNFGLGLGPCGKIVEALGVTESASSFTIHQHHTDGTSKSFIYQWDDICGRIQLEFEG